MYYKKAIATKKEKLYFCSQNNKTIKYLIRRTK